MTDRMTRRKMTDRERVLRAVTWRDGATEFELARVLGIDKRLAMLREQEHELSHERSMIANRCINRAKYAARRLRK